MVVSIAILGAIERGTRNPESKVIKNIAEALGVEVEELISSKSTWKEG